MEQAFQVCHLDTNRLLAEWRWLCDEPMELIARNAFADLFLRNRAGEILQLDVSVGRLMKIASSRDEFLMLVDASKKRRMVRRISGKSRRC